MDSSYIYLGRYSLKFTNLLTKFSQATSKKVFGEKCYTYTNIFYKTSFSRSQHFLDFSKFSNYYTYRIRRDSIFLEYFKSETYIPSLGDRAWLIASLPIFKHFNGFLFYLERNFFLSPSTLYATKTFDGSCLLFFFWMQFKLAPFFLFTLRIFLIFSVRSVLFSSSYFNKLWLLFHNFLGERVSRAPLAEIPFDLWVALISGPFVLKFIP